MSVLGATLLALFSSASADAATVTVGSPLTAAFSANYLPPFAGTHTNTALSEPGAHVVSPVAGTVVRWRITQATGGPFKLRVLTPGSGTYTGAGTSLPQTPASTAIQTYATDLPIRAGQAIGIDNSTASDQVGITAVTDSSFSDWMPPLADGETRAPSVNESNFELGFNADVQPLPSVSSVSPSSGSTSGGTPVTITGQNFEGTTAVSFGSTPARSFTVMSDNVITAVAPASSAGTVDISVRNPGQSATSLADRFTFATAPTTRKCVVPKLKGKTLKNARKALKKAHCKLGKVKGPKGNNARIKKQKPKAGKILKADSRVRVTTKRKK